MLVQERLEIELLWKDVVQLPQSAHDGAALVAPRAEVAVHQRVVYGDLDLTQVCKRVQNVPVAQMGMHSYNLSKLTSVPCRTNELLFKFVKLPLKDSYRDVLRHFGNLQSPCFQVQVGKGVAGLAKPARLS